MALALRAALEATIDPNPPRNPSSARFGFVLLDLYDTLVGFDREQIRAERSETARQLGVTLEDLERADKATMPGRMIGEYGLLHSALEEMLRVAGARVNPVDVDWFVDRELATWERAVIVFPVVRPALDRLLDAGVRLGLVSNCCYLTPPLLVRWNLRRYFDSVSLSCQVGCVKPSHAIFEHALGAIGGHREDGLLVDDKQCYVDAAGAIGLSGRRIARGDRSDETGAIRTMTQLADELIGVS